MNKANKAPPVEELLDAVRKEIIRRGDVSDEEVYEIAEDVIFSHSGCRRISLREKNVLADRIFCSLRREFGILEPFIAEPSVSEIMVNGIEDIFIEQNGRIIRCDMKFSSVEELEEIIRKMAAGVRREINELNPIVDARLPGGARVNAVYKNIALGGPVLTIRKFPERALTMQDLIDGDTLTREAADFLKMLVEAGYNIFVCGGTSSGKTTFLNVLSDFIPKDERVIVIEDSAELQIRGIKNLIRLECRNANFEGKGQIDMQALIKTSLRMRPDRIIVGEVRGKEVIDMLQAMNTGHDGSLSTGHGNSIDGMLKRLEAMFLQGASFPIEAIRTQISEGIDVIVHLGRLADKKRRVLEIAEISKERGDGGIRLNTIFKYKHGEGLAGSAELLQNRAKLMKRRMETG